MPSFRLGSFALAVSLSAAGCGSSGAGGAPVDGGAADASTDGRALVDAGGDGDAAGYAPAPPGAMLLQPGTALELRGVTDDGWVLYVDPGAHTLFAEPIAGGARQSVLANVDATVFAYVSGSVAFVWSASASGVPTGDAGVWTSAHGFASLPRGVAFPYVGASSDGSVVAYATATQVFVGTPDLASTTAFDLSPIGLAFAGRGENVIVEHATGDAGAGSAAITLIGSVAPRTATDVLTGVDAAPPFAVDADGTRVLARLQDGALWTASLVGAASPTRLDDAVSDTFVLSADGAVAFYDRLDGSLRRTSTLTPAPALLTNAGDATIAVAGYPGAPSPLSPDGAWIALETGSGVGSAVVGVASATTAGPPTTLAATGLLPRNAYFTPDGALLYYAGAAGGDKPLRVHPLPTGAEQTLSMKAGFVHVAGARTYFGDGTDFYTRVAYPHEDVRLLGAQGSTLVVARAHYLWQPSPNGDRVLYTSDGSAGPPGLYAVAVP